MSNQLSRRYLIAAAASAPLALNGAAPAAPAKPAGAPPPTARVAKADPIIAKVDAWIAERDAIEAMMEEWADLEVALCERAEPLGLSLTQACRSGLPEARAMRALDRQIKPGLKRLERQAGRLALMRSTTAQGALAKIRLAARIQGPFDWQEDYVYTLVQDGCEQLALLLGAEA